MEKQNEIGSDGASAEELVVYEDRIVTTKKFSEHNVTCGEDLIYLKGYEAGYLAAKNGEIYGSGVFLIKRSPRTSSKI
jgi:hypothetical protein